MLLVRRLLSRTLSFSETGDKLSDNASFAPQKPNGEQPEDSIWKTAHYIAHFERVGDSKPIDPVKPGGDDSKDSYYFAIEKIDAQDSHALNGATFALYQYSSDGKTVNRTTATTSRNGSESGIALFSVDNKNSYEGIWYYAEVTAPEGYVLDSTEHKITKNDFSTSQSAAIRNAETVRNYRSSTPNMLNDTDHFAYVIGYKDGLVKPYGLITRAETTAIFFRLLKDIVRDIRSDFYDFDEENYLIRGKRTGKVFRLGDPVRIRVKSANLEQRLLDYELIDQPVDGTESGVDEYADAQEPASAGTAKGDRTARGTGSAKGGSRRHPGGEGDPGGSGEAEPHFTAGPSDSLRRPGRAEASAGAGGFLRRRLRRSASCRHSGGAWRGPEKTDSKYLNPKLLCHLKHRKTVKIMRCLLP